LAQSAVISSAAAQAGVAAAAGEKAKGNQYFDIVNQSGGDFILLVCESFGAWMPSALSTLFSINSQKLFVLLSCYIYVSYCSNFQ